MKKFLLTLLIGFGISSCNHSVIELQPISEANYSVNSIASLELNEALLNSQLRLTAATTSGKEEVPYQRNENISRIKHGYVHVSKKPTKHNVTAE